MAMMEKNVLGMDGFVYGIGVVESRQDPLFLGRVKVRVFGIHTPDLNDIKTADLPWATVAQPTNSNAPPDLKEGERVMVCFADGRSCQIPIVMFRLPGFSTVQNQTDSGFNDLRTDDQLENSPRRPESVVYNTDGSGADVNEADAATRYPLPTDINKPSLSGATRYNIESTVTKNRKENLVKSVKGANGIVWDEPYPAYNPLYPFNNATESESGHLVEIDDTPGNERLSMLHRTGTGFEVYPSGTKVEKITKSNYTLILGDDFVNVMGQVAITVNQDCSIRVVGDVNLEVDNDFNALVAGDINWSAGGSFNVRAKGLQFDIDALDDPPTQQDATEGNPDPEEVPVPFDLDTTQLDAYTGAAYKQSQISEKPTANNAPAKTGDYCGFQPNLKTFLPKSKWKLSAAGLNQLKSLEKLAKKTPDGKVACYLDTVADVLTIGWGTTQAVLDDFTLMSNTVVSVAQCEVWLADSVKNVFLPALKRGINVNLTQNQVDAMLIMIYNVGPGNFRKSKVRQYTNAQQWCQAKDAFGDLVYVKGVLNQGLVARRKIEATLYAS